MTEWVVLELTPRSEGEDPDVISQAITRSLKEAEVFVPAAVTDLGDERLFKYLVEGYVFVRKTRPDTDYLRLEGTRYIQSVLTSTGPGKSRKLATVGQGEIDRMRSQILEESDQGISVGDVVRIISGPYKNIEAEVVEEIPEQGLVQLYVKLRSKQSVVTLPRSVLRVMARSPLSMVRAKLASLIKWAAAATRLAEWEPPNGLGQKLEEYTRLSLWEAQIGQLEVLTAFEEGGLDQTLGRVASSYEALCRIISWGRHGRPLYDYVGSYYKSGERLAGLVSKLEDLERISRITSRARIIRKELEAMGREMQNDVDETSVQNVLVDGYNLAFRCLYAPGMGNLKDATGRPTGVVVGFLKSLGSLRKRFPGCALHVVWDGSSKRRKGVFGAYKANRKVRPVVDGPEGFDQAAFLREVLPQLNVRQYYNAQEEADDVIAALVRGVFSEQTNVVYSTDRDLLQLVTGKTRVLMPGAGTRKEILYDSKGVLEDFGVDPKDIVQLRAFYGDASDNIPGVPRVPKKVLRALLQTHGSIEGVYTSGLSGLTRSQYEKLRSAEPQVRLNVELMSLVDVPYTCIEADPYVSAAVARLQELNIQPEAILKALGLS